MLLCHWLCLVLLACSAARLAHAAGPPLPPLAPMKAVLTASGRLFVARKPAKGKKRTVDPVVADGKRPILGMVVDALEQHTFLFLQSAKGPAFFELSDKPDLVV